MEAPDMKESGGVYSLSWKEIRISLRADRIQSHHEVISAEIKIMATGSNSSGHLSISRLNLTSTRERQVLVNRLEKRWESVEWDTLIEQACLMILTDYRKGEPVVILADMPDNEALEALLAPFLVEGQPSIVFGFGGSGKSLLATYFAILVATGIQASSSRLLAKQGKVLYLDWESGAIEIKQRLRGLCLGMNIQQPGNRLIYRRCFQPLSAEIDTIQQLCAEHQVKLLVVDSVGLACGGEPEKADSVLGFFRALRSLNTTSLNIDHLAKGPQDNRAATPFGSVYKINMARSVWECKKGEAAEEHQLSLGLFHRKANFGRLEQPRGYRVSFEPTGPILINATDPADDPELVGNMTVKDRLVRALREGRMTAKDLSDNLGIPYSSVRVNLIRFKDKRFIQLDKEWGLYQSDKEDGTVTL